MRASHIVVAALGAIAAVAAAPACRAPTEIKIEITTDVKCADVKGTAITIGDLVTVENKPATTVTTACDPNTGRIGSMVVVPSGAKDDVVAIKVVMGVGRDPAECVPPAYGLGCVVARRAVQFVESSSLYVPMFLALVCSGVQCDPSQTCSGGKCTNATIDDPTKCEAPNGCNEGTLPPSPPADAGPQPDVVVPMPADAAPCMPGVPCDVVSSPTILDVAVAKSLLFWIDSTGVVFASALDGAGARVIARDTPPLAGIEADGEYVYWTGNSFLKRVRLADGVIQTLANIQGGCLRWMTPSTHLWAGAPAFAGVYLIDFVQLKVFQPIGGASVPWGVAGPSLMDVYYTNSTTTGAIRHNDGTQGVSPYLVMNQNTPRCLATDGASLWWGNYGAGTLVKSTIAGQNVQELATGQTNITGVALDDTTVYWSWQGGIRKRTK